jgi:hypothetical protein
VRLCCIWVSFPCSSSASGDTIPHVIRFIFMFPNLRSVPTSVPFLYLFADRRFTITFTTICIPYPLSLYRDIHKLSMASSFALCGMLIIAQNMHLSEICSLIFMWQVFPSSNLIFAGFGVLLSVCILINFAWAIVTHASFRQLKLFEQAKTLLSTSLSDLKSFSNVSRSTQQCRRPHWQK